MSDPNALKFYNGKCFTNEQLRSECDLKKLNFPVPPTLESNRHLSAGGVLKSSDAIVDELVGHFVDAYNVSEEAGTKLLLEYDQHSLRSYLRLALEARGMCGEDEDDSIK